jgi:hypothetical protein
MVETNTENGIAVTYIDTTGKLNFEVSNPVITLSGDVTGQGTLTNLSNLTITTTIAANSVALGTDTTGEYVANIAANTTTGFGGITISGSGSETAAVVIGINPANADFIENIQDIVGGMVETNTENGIAVTYNDTTNKLNFDVADFTITLTGDVTGQGTVTDLTNVSFITTIAANSVVLGTDTVGNYVTTIAPNATTGYGGIVVNGSGAETAAVTIGIDKTNADFRNSVQDIAAGIFATGNGLVVSYNDTTNILTINPNDPVIAIAGAVVGSQTMTDLGNTTITVAQANDSVTLGTHTVGNYVATIAANTAVGYSGIVIANSGVETANVVIGIDTTNADFRNAIRDFVAPMFVTGNGLTVSYTDTTAGGTVVINPNDPLITITGSVSGSQTMTDLGATTITVAPVANAITLGPHTSGNYVATITANTAVGQGGITVSGSGSETAAVTIGLDTTNADFRNSVRDLVAPLFSTGNGISVTYTDTALGGSIILDPNDPTISLTGVVTGSQVMTNLGNVGITTTLTDNSVTLGQHTVGAYVANITGTNGVTVSTNNVETAAVTLGIDRTNADFRDIVEDITAGLFSTTHNGLTATYNDDVSTLVLSVRNPTITLAGDVVGSQIMTNLGDVTINATIQPNSVELGTDTTGNYVANITASTVFGRSGIVVENSGTEIANVVIGIDTTNSDFRNAVRDFVAPMFTTGNGLTVVYADTITGGTVEINPNDPLITITGSVIGSQTMTNLGDTTITVAQADNSVTLGQHTVGNYVANVAAGKGITVANANVETADITVSVDTGDPLFVEDIQDIFGLMLSGNTENGINVVYEDDFAKITFDVNDPTITLAGDVTGSVQMIDLGSVTINCTVADSSHDHTIANVIGLQAALDAKVGGGDLALTGTTTVQNLNPALNSAYSLGTTDLRFTNVWATTLNGTAVRAQYADLAERYHADAKYPIGTVVKLGGSKEITATTTEDDAQVIGVISENPAYLMNDGAGDPNEWLAVAMTGRVRVKIVGPVTKGQRIVSSNDTGVAKAVNDNEITSIMTVIGRALRSNIDPNIKLVECIIGKL